MAGLTALLDSRIEDPTLVQAVRIDGRFSRLKVRSVPAQTPPYRPLNDIVPREQTVFDLTEAVGTLVGFRFPSDLAGANVAGWHLHFIAADRRTGGHGSKQIERREIEVERRVVGQSIVGSDLERLDSPLDERDRVAMGECDTFGLSGRARRVEHVGEVVLDHRHAGILVGLRGEGRPVHARQPGDARGVERVVAEIGVPERAHRCATGERLVQLGAARGERHEPRSLAIANDVDEPRRRCVGIDRHVSGTSLHHTVESDDCFERLGQPQGHAITTPHAVGAQRVREAIRLLVERVVGELAILHDDRVVLGPRMGRGAQQMVQ